MSEAYFIESVMFRRIFFIFDQKWPALAKREISEKLAIFVKMSLTKVRFYTLQCALLELLFKLKFFFRKNCTHFSNKQRIGGYHRLTSYNDLENRNMLVTPRLSTRIARTDFSMIAKSRKRV